MTVNPIVAVDADGKIGFHCRKVSSGCAFCYAETFNRRRLPHRGTGLGYTRRNADQVTITRAPKAFEEVERLKKPEGWRIFWCSMTDLFGSFVPHELTMEVLDAAAAAADRGYVNQILTKRAGRVPMALSVWCHTRRRRLPEGVWIGFSAEDQKNFDARLPGIYSARDYMDGPIWCSYEPALGPIDFERAAVNDRVAHARVTEPAINLLDWVVVGGESGSRARMFDLQWARQTVRQCQAAGTPVFVKQLGTRWARRRRYMKIPPPKFGDPSTFTTEPIKDGKGENLKWWPLDLCVREFPTGTIT